MGVPVATSERWRRSKKPPAMIHGSGLPSICDATFAATAAAAYRRWVATRLPSHASVGRSSSSMNTSRSASDASRRARLRAALMPGSTSTT